MYVYSLSHFILCSLLFCSHIAEKNHIKGYLKLYNFIHVNCISFALITYTGVRAFIISLYNSWTAAIKLIDFVFLIEFNKQKKHTLNIIERVYLHLVCMVSHRQEWRPPIPIKFIWLLFMLFIKGFKWNSSLKFTFFPAAAGFSISKRISNWMCFQFCVCVFTIFRKWHFKYFSLTHLTVRRR